MENPALDRRYDGQIAQVFALLEKIVIDGLRHGFFDCAIECEMVAGKKRNLVIRAGKFHKFIIAEDEFGRMQTMTEKKGKSGTIDVKTLLARDEEFLRALVRTALDEVLEAEMTEALGAEKGERTAGRLGYRSGYYGRTLITRIGKPA